MSGLKGYLAIAKETTYGTAVVPTESMEFLTESIDPDPGYIISQQVRNGRMAPSSSRRQRVSNQAAGPVNLEVPTKGFWRLLDLLKGGTVTATQVMDGVTGTGAYTRTYLDGRGTDLDAKSATAVVGRPMTAGGVQPFTYLGGMVTGYTLTANQGEFATFQPTFDFQAEDPAIAAPAITYPADLGGFVLEDAVLLVDGAEPAAVVRGFNMSVTRPMATDRRGANSSGNKRKPVQNGVWGGEATVESEFYDMDLVNKFREKNRISALVLTLKGIKAIYTGAITVYPQLKVTLGAVGYQSASPNVGGADLLELSVGLTILDNDAIAAPVEFVYQSAEI